MSTTAKDIVQAFVVENFLFGDHAHPLAGSDSLIENGVIDSTGVLELVAFLEERFEITMADSEIVPDNLDSLDRIVAFIASKATAPIAA
ncbi:MAG: acyl carrier protein [Hyphomicrobiales bacterium]|jgi:acyl carrier protein|nr:acyl carrier protein [Hyphomicrobiales bacterium]